MLKGLYKKKKIKTMNIKLVANSQLSTTESKKQAKHTARQEENNRRGDYLEGTAGRGKGHKGAEGPRIKKY